MKIVNLTQHAPTTEQIEAGVFDGDRTLLLPWLNFTSAPTRAELQDRAAQIADFAASTGADAAMLGGAPYLMGPLGRALERHGIQPLFSFTERQSAETIMPDGSVSKTSVFRHVGFVWA